MSHDKDIKTKKTKIIFEGITAKAWEHPADAIALKSLENIPGLDKLIRTIFGSTTEKSIRLMTLASSVRVSERQFPKIYKSLLETCEILDLKKIPELYVGYDPYFNAGAVGMDNPFIVLNSGLTSMVNKKELQGVIAHEVGHIMSGHVLYKTLLVILLRFSTLLMNIPLGALTLSGIVAGLREWDRKSELSADRAGLLVTQDMEVSANLLMKMAGGNNLNQMNLDAFLEQAEEYHNSTSISETMYKFMNTLSTTHPFPVSRLLELHKWSKSEQFSSILSGDYSVQEQSYSENFKKATESYTEDFKHAMKPVEEAFDEAAQKAKDIFGNIFKK